MRYTHARHKFPNDTMNLTSESSSDDDIYVGSASHLRALKKRPPRSADIDTGGDDDPDDDYESSGSVDSSCSASADNSVRVTPSSASIPKRPVRSCRRGKKVTPAETTRNASLAASTRPSLSGKSDVEAETIDLDGAETHDPVVVDDDYCTDVKVMWRSSSLKRFKMRRYEPFERIFKYFAEMESVPAKQVLLMKGERPLLKSDTPASIDLRVIDILEGGIIDASVANNDSSSVPCCTIKIQTSASTRKRMSFQLEMEETFDRVVYYCAEVLEVDPSRIRLIFDGEDIGPGDTPESLDLEREACIDLLLRPL